jgi:isopentenyl diphosphate isomerase/L-lactate dehydrogenase-like FMN-dependent dehydrogenase
VIGRGVDSRRFDPARRSIALRESWGVAADDLVVLYVGRLAAEKNVWDMVDAVQGKLPILIDGGFRRGTDIFKALALGARGICIGRPYIWGLAAFGQAGVDKVLDILTRELALMMRHAGTTSVGKIDRRFITTSVR